jgi:hypothetical protein
MLCVSYVCMHELCLCCYYSHLVMLFIHVFMQYALQFIENINRENFEERVIMTSTQLLTMSATN